MRKFFLWLPCALFVFALALNTSKFNGSRNLSYTDSVAELNNSLSLQLFNSYVADIYCSAQLHDSGLDPEVFQKAITGYFNLKSANKIAFSSSIITIIDFAQSSCTKRMWIVDLQKKQLVLNTWVAHGENSGDDMACHFSNDVNSYESSLGFYITNDVYMGKHGRSLRLNGMDDGFNNMASERDIVLHAAKYVGPESIKTLGRLGRSQGCPAVSPLVANRIIDTIKGKTVLFINGNDSSYTSKYLDANMAVRFAFLDDMPATKTAL